MASAIQYELESVTAFLMEFVTQYALVFEMPYALGSDSESETVSG